MKEVKVKWIDSVSGDSAWHLMEDHDGHGITRPTSYGFVIAEDDEKIVLAQTYSEGNKDVPAQYNGTIAIPKCAIVDMQVLNSGEQSHKTEGEALASLEAQFNNVPKDIEGLSVRYRGVWLPNAEYARSYNMVDMVYNPRDRQFYYLNRDGKILSLTEPQDSPEIWRKYEE